MNRSMKMIQIPVALNAFAMLVAPFLVFTFFGRRISDENPDDVEGCSP